MIKLISHPATGSATVTPGVAAAIDRKLDDGKPGTGFVAAESVGAGCKDNDSSSARYQETDTRKVCQMYFRL